MKASIKFIVSLLLMVLPFVQAQAYSYITKAYVTVKKPVVGQKPVNEATLPASASTKASSVQWIGNFDESGCFKAGESYTVRVKLQVKSGVDKLLRNSSSSVWHINGKAAKYTDIKSAGGKACWLQYGFPRIGMGTSEISSVDIQMVEPVIGQRPDARITIAGTDDVVVLSSKWSGDFDADGCFMPNMPYQLIVKLGVKEGSVGHFNPMSSSNKFTLNGKPKRIYGPKATTLTVTHSVNLGEDQLYLDRTKMYSLEEANRYHYVLHPITVDVSKAYHEEYTRLKERSALKDSLYVGGYIDRVIGKLSAEEKLRVDKVLIDIPDRESFGFLLLSLPNLKEVWFGPKSKPQKLLQELAVHRRNNLYMHGSQYVNSGDVTVFLPYEKFPKGLSTMSENLKFDAAWSVGIPGTLLKFRTNTYKGDMYEAFNKGKSATERYCPGHDFSAKVPADYSTMRHATCKQNMLFYYSCKYCGECEYNPSHTFQMDEYLKPKTVPLVHTYSNFDLSGKNYVGRNPKGEKVFMMTCYWCGINPKEDAQNKGQRMEQWQSPLIDKILERTFSDTWTDGYFAVPECDHGAKTSSWAENYTRWAMVNKLIDKELLGTNYQQNVSQLQLLSLAVKFAEHMTLKEIVPAAGGENIYIRKGRASGIIPDNTTLTFSSGTFATRQEMAVLLYRALQYIKNNSGFRYTVYTPSLDKYPDRSQIAPWAVKAMEFMEVLGIVEPVSNNMIAPMGKCTIEEAVVAAQKSTFADELGWHQAVHWGGKEHIDGGSGWYCYEQPIIDRRGKIVMKDFVNGDRIWVSEPWIKLNPFTKKQGSSLLPFKDEITGATLFYHGGDFFPIKEL